MSITIDIGFGGVINNGQSYADIKGGKASNTIWTGKQTLHSAKAPFTTLDLRSFLNTEGRRREIEDFAVSNYNVFKALTKQETVNLSKKGISKSSLYHKLAVVDIKDEHKVLVRVDAVVTNNEVFKFVLIKKDTKDATAKSGSFDTKQAIVPRLIATKVAQAMEVARTGRLSERWKPLVRFNFDRNPGRAESQLNALFKILGDEILNDATVCDPAVGQGIAQRFVTAVN